MLPTNLPSQHDDPTIAKTQPQQGPPHPSGNRHYPPVPPAEHGGPSLSPHGGPQKPPHPDWPGPQPPYSAAPPAPYDHYSHYQHPQQHTVMGIPIPQFMESIPHRMGMVDERHPDENNQDRAGSICGSILFVCGCCFPPLWALAACLPLCFKGSTTRAIGIASGVAFLIVVIIAVVIPSIFARGSRDNV